ncbi:MAG TPA: GNAT family N-acetyltransferase [Rhizomicrobium sp.]|nr:GNAT family N-acetyltransferase [Rhizomicrobium sp.]
MSQIIIRSARDEDSEDLIRLIDNAYREYPGCVLDVDIDMPELRRPASAVTAESGRWWVAELDGAVVGSVAVTPQRGKVVELKKLYVSPLARKRGLGEYLVKLAESEARSREAQMLILWTDTRFENAHRLYDRLGFVRAPETRALNDGSNTIEYHYSKELGA